MTIAAGEKLLYSPDEAAELLGCSRAWVFELVARKELESVKLGRLRRIPHDALVAYVQGLRASASGTAGDAASA